MATATHAVLASKFSRSPGRVGVLVFALVLVVGLACAGSSLINDLGNHSGLQWGTVRNLLMAWVLTLPASIALAFLFWAFRQFA